MLYVGLVIATLFCAFQVMRAERLMIATIWLAFSSALVAILLYLLGGREVAVIELSVGAGLVTVLFVFAFSIVGEATIDLVTLIPRLLVWILILSVSFVLGALVLPLGSVEGAIPELSFGQILWEQRGPDVLAQIVLIFAGVVGVVGLLSESKPGRKESMAAAGREHPETILPAPPNGHSPETEPELEKVHG